MTLPSRPLYLPRTMHRERSGLRIHEIITPSYAVWFDISKIHPVERRALPENLAGDVCAIMRDHAFLEQWGLINYQVNPDTRPVTLAPPSIGHFHDASAAKNGAANTGSSATPASLELRSNIYQSTAKASREVSSSEAKALTNGSSHPGSRSVSLSCNTCGVDCTPVRYHSLKNKGYELCPPCYLGAQFPSSMFSGDFVKLMAPQSTSAHGVNGNGDGGWSDQEILPLLEDVKMYDDDWSLLEEHVSTRSVQQCIRKSLKLPIEDPSLEAESEGSKGPLRYARLPFEQADNPVMSVVAILAGVVGRGVAAEAAKAALHELIDGDKDKKDGEAVKTDRTYKENDEKTDEAMESADKEHKPEDVGGSDNDMAVDAIDGTTEKPSTAIPHSKVARAAHLALRSPAKVARALADTEATSVRTVLSQLIKFTLSRLELKMGQFEEMETALKEECCVLEAQQLALARAHGAALAQGVALGSNVTEVGSGTPLEREAGPVAERNFQ
ncbi:hypothetical protein DFH11DRAFT_1773751 [Phellopilus nigrolimitatus]|nr:hypothetical protein DFH11DRAFT_1773751 [Phellopilus nigrolimitatus]